ETILEKHGNPTNNLLPRLPELQDVWGHPQVRSALGSILGHDYYLHLHRHCHNNMPGSKGQGMHKDSLHNSRFAVDENRRHHHTRWLMAFYYPQDTPVELGPTAVMPQSQYLMGREPFTDDDELALTGEAGTITIVHYDLLHRGMANVSDKTRHMVKFLFTRMSEPTTPSWNHTGAEWESSDDPQDAIRRHMWDWHRGRVGETPIEPTASLEELVGRLSDESELVAVNAAYELSSMGKAAVPHLVNALGDERETTRRYAMHSFNRIGEVAVGGLTDALDSEDAGVRARAADVLGDMGLRAASSRDALTRRANDEDETARNHATEALGTTSQDTDAATETLGNTLASDGNGLVRRNAALSLARLGKKAEGAIPSLTKALRDENHYVRGFSVHALRRIDTPEATDAVLNHLEAMRWD
ncbi:MAG: HEAT repeat domain-containing protein, partial [Candidatus Poribacteria bacterium]|nr:HEAT repeat domain-containing protein [Candidatus Poribacteria bacterium]